MIIKHEGNNISYSFYGNYDSGSLPKYKITYQIPNSSFNEAEIINKTHEIYQLKEEIIDIQQDIKWKKDDMNYLDKYLAQLNKEKLDKEQKKQQLLKEPRIIDTIINNLNDRILNKTKEIKGLTESYDESIEIENSKLQEVQKSINELNNKYKQISLIFITQSDTLKMLQKFALLITEDNERDIKSQKINLVNLQCKQFVEAYDENIENILNLSKRNLNLN